MLPSTSRSMRSAAAVAALIALPLLGFTKAAQHPLVAARPAYGGTLRLVAAYGPDHLDTVPAYYSADYVLERAYARQLVSYPSVADPSATSRGWKEDTTPAADAARVVPTVANGGVTDRGRTYTFHIRRGVEWDTVPARQVTAGDFVREFKAFCNPASGGFVGNLSYYSATIVGLGSYCDAETAYFNNLQHPPTAADITKFQNSHTIAGVTALNSLTLRFRLFRPASDFLYMLTLPFASARPVEYDRYLPNSLALNQHTISDGPYQITYFRPFASLRPAVSIVLQRNRAWKQSTDPLRHQYVKKITVTAGVFDAQTQVNALRAGKYDLMLDTSPPPASIHLLRSDRDFHIWPGNNLLPYLVFNFRSPNSKHAIARLYVRRAIEYGVDKAAVSQVLGGPAVAPILDSVIPPGNLGQLSRNPYPSRGSRGNAARCQALLAKAGYKHGLKLRYEYPSDTFNASVFLAVQASLMPCGINLIGVPVSGADFFVDLSNAPVNDLPGTFDLASPGWIPDWFGNSGRTFVEPLFRTDCVLGTNNYGCYSSHLVDRLITAAETAHTPGTAAAYWRQANAQIMKDAAVVPLVDGQNSIYASPRVHEAGVAHGVLLLPVIDGPDITNVWIKKG